MLRIINPAIYPNPTFFLAPPDLTQPSTTGFGCSESDVIRNLPVVDTMKAVVVGRVDVIDMVTRAIVRIYQGLAFQA